MCARARADKLRGMLRRSVVLIVLALVAVAAPSASAKAKAPKRCPKGQVRITAKAPCVKPKVTTIIKVTDAKAEARFRKVAGRRAARAAAKALTAIHAGSDRGRRARIADLGEDHADGQWHDKVIDGHPGRFRLLETIVEGDRPGRTTEATSEVTIKGDDGGAVTVTVGAKTKIWFTACPDANGIARARTEVTHIDRKAAKLGRESAFTELTTTTTADITVQVGDDAEVAKVTYDGAMDVEVRASDSSTRRYIMGWSHDAPGPDVEQRPSTAQAISADPAGALAGTYRGPHGADLTAEDVQVLINMRIVGQDTAEGLSMRDILLLMKFSWQSDGTCVKLVLDPHTMALAGGETGTFNATATIVKDGTPATGSVDEIAGGGTVDQPHTTMGADGRLTVRFTMGQSSRGTLLVEVTSKRGKGSDLVDITRPQGWDITYEGDGTYSQTLTHGTGDVDTTNMTFHWKADYPGIFFDGGSYSPMGHSRVTGALATRGTLGTGTFSCTGTPSWVQSTIMPAPAPDGGTALTLIPFTAVGADSQTVECDREGYGGDYGGVEALTNHQPYVAHVVVTRDMLTQPEFSVPVTFGTGFPANCGVDAPDTCSESGTLTATVHFKRRDG
jgi:hypothetical protein